MQLIGHRGARGEAPENTLGGFVYLHQLGVRAVEFDIRQMLTGELVVLHDDNLKRTTGVNLPVAALTPHNRLAYSHTLLHPAWPYHEPTPLLSDVLGTLTHFNHLELEIKTVSDAAAATRLVNTLGDVLKNATVPHSAITITSFDTQVLHAAQQQLPNIQRGLLLEANQTLSLPTLQQLGCTRVGIHFSLLPKVDVPTLHQHGLKVSVWTVNDPHIAQLCLEQQVDGLITDYPTRIQRALAIPFA